MRLSWIIAAVVVVASLAALAWLIHAWWQGRRRCRHELSLRNAAGTSAWRVRVSAHTPATQILAAAAPPGWVQTPGYPQSVLWRPAAVGPIPPGDPLPGPFAVWIQNDAQQDKRVLVEWDLHPHGAGGFERQRPVVHHQPVDERLRMHLSARGARDRPPPRAAAPWRSDSRGAGPREPSLAEPGRVLASCGGPSFLAAGPPPRPRRRPRM